MQGSKSAELYKNLVSFLERLDKDPIYKSRTNQMKLLILKVKFLLFFFLIAYILFFFFRVQRKIMTIVLIDIEFYVELNQNQGIKTLLQDEESLQILFQVNHWEIWDFQVLDFI